MLRTHTCGELSASHADADATICGWVHAVRDQKKGGLYIDLRDRYGLTQVRINYEAQLELYNAFKNVHKESVLRVRGRVERRPEGMVNQKLATGEIELAAAEVALLNTCADLPLEIRARDNELAGEETRLKFRYLDLRRPSMQKKMFARYQTIEAIRASLGEDGFIDIETPLMMRSTPEGSRDFVVPSRTFPGQFYALPQSPQIYKQLLMVSGYDKYFQMARCFRDEDARRGRQLVFTQIDLEMSFVHQEDVFAVVEKFLVAVSSKVYGIEVETPFPRFSYAECIRRWGIDKPDLRFGLELCTLQDLFAASPLPLLAEAQANGLISKAMRVPGGASSVKKKILKGFENHVRSFGAQGLFTTKYKDGAFATGAAKHIPAEAVPAIVERVGLEEGDLLMFVTGSPVVANKAMGNLRNIVGDFLNLRPGDDWKFLWVVDFPLFEQDEQSGAWNAMHHLFSMPRSEFIGKLREDPGAVMAQLYDVVLNGVEIGSGSIRVHDPALQLEIMDICGIPEALARERFGFLLEALGFGAPPHGGIALGIDNLVMTMLGETNIREAIAFPNSSNGRFLCDGSPSALEPDQIEELHLRVQVESPATA